MLMMSNMVGSALQKSDVLCLASRHYIRSFWAYIYTLNELYFYLNSLLFV